MKQAQTHLTSHCKNYLKLKGKGIITRVIRFWKWKKKMIKINNLITTWTPPHLLHPILYFYHSAKTASLPYKVKSLAWKLVRKGQKWLYITSFFNKKKKLNQLLKQNSLYPRKKLTWEIVVCLQHIVHDRLWMLIITKPVRLAILWQFTTQVLR